MGDKYASKEAVDLVLATGIIESRYEYIKQMNDGPAASFFQIEPASAVDNCQHFLSHRKSLMQNCAFASRVDIKYWQMYDLDIWSEILEKTLQLVLCIAVLSIGAYLNVCQILLKEWRTTGKNFIIPLREKEIQKNLLSKSQDGSSSLTRYS